MRTEENEPIDKKKKKPGGWGSGFDHSKFKNFERKILCTVYISNGIVKSFSVIYYSLNVIVH